MLFGLCVNLCQTERFLVEILNGDLARPKRHEDSSQLLMRAMLAAVYLLENAKK